MVNVDEKRMGYTVSISLADENLNPQAGAGYDFAWTTKKSKYRQGEKRLNGLLCKFPKFLLDPPSVGDKILNETVSGNISVHDVIEIEYGDDEDDTFKTIMLWVKLASKKKEHLTGEVIKMFEIGYTVQDLMSIMELITAERLSIRDIAARMGKPSQTEWVACALETLAESGYITLPEKNSNGVRPSRAYRVNIPVVNASVHSNLIQVRQVQ